MRQFLTAIFALIFLTASSQELNPQEQLKENIDKPAILSVSWSVAMPMGELTNYNKMTSGRGFLLEINQMVNEKWTYGGTFGWQAFFDKNQIWYIGKNSVISGTRRNYVNSLAFMGSTKYYFTTSVSGVKAYLNLEAGATVIENYEIFGLYTYRELEWHFALSPGLGIDVPATDKMGLQVSFKYYNSFKNNSSIHYSWFNVGLGVYLKISD